MHGVDNDPGFAMAFKEKAKLWMQIARLLGIQHRVLQVQL
jgi:hypothetical protein